MMPITISYQSSNHFVVTAPIRILLLPPCGIRRAGYALPIVFDESFTIVPWRINKQMAVCMSIHMSVHMSAESRAASSQPAAQHGQAP